MTKSWNIASIINKSIQINNRFLSHTFLNIILLSNDVNLCIKAASYSIEVMSGFRGNANDLINQLYAKYRAPIDVSYFLTLI